MSAVKIPGVDDRNGVLASHQWDLRHSLALGFVLLSSRLLAADTNSVSVPKFLGAQSCSSSSCHGGADDKSNQYTIWSTRDFHHQRPYATLTTARSERFADVLKIGDVTRSPRCTVCHAPLAAVPAERLAKGVQISEGISCETCHGPAENWIRSHTRSDYTHADRVASGMRDLKNLYVRANTCVACHQNLDPEIRAAGHPELIFEMDGQSVTMPRHWSKTNDSLGAQAWLVGQAVALREMSWQLCEMHGFDLKKRMTETNLVARIFGASWVLRTATGDKAVHQVMPEDFESIRRWADEVAGKQSEGTWSSQQARECLTRLADSGSAYLQEGIGRELKSRRAERLVLALDRLAAALPEVSSNSTVNESLNKLFADAQSLPDFDPNQFAKDLKAFQTSVSTLESK